jgi:hypothetical protein
LQLGHDCQHETANCLLVSWGLLFQFANQIDNQGFHILMFGTAKHVVKARAAKAIVLQYRCAAVIWHQELDRIHENPRPAAGNSLNPRSFVVIGLPKSTINITIDGVNVQNKEDKAGDGFYTWIRPRIDSIEQVTVSTSAQSADSAGEGAVQIKFVRRSGGNDYHGSLYEYHRNPALAANY